MKTSLFFSSAVGTVCLFTLMSLALHADTNFLLKVDGINHGNWIDVESFHTSGTTFQITKRIDGTSAQFNQASVSGKPIPEATVLIKRENRTLKFSDVLITSIEMLPGGTPMEQCTFAFRKSS